MALSRPCQFKMLDTSKIKGPQIFKMPNFNIKEVKIKNVIGQSLETWQADLKHITHLSKYCAQMLAHHNIGTVSPEHLSDVKC